MKKSTFYIRLANKEHAKYQLISGYIDTINGVEVGFFKGDSGFWHVAHIKSGLYITGGCRRLEDMAEVLSYCIEKAHEKKNIYKMKLKTCKSF